MALKNRFSIAFACLCSIALLNGTAHAGVKEEMNSFYNDMGGAANVTGPAAYKGQSAGYYTGGSIWTRSPTKNVNPVNLQLPKISAGCGGIDVFTGSFSFINAGEFVSLMKATANNALGFAFKLAIDSISAQIGTSLSEMLQKVQDMNNLNINSCEQGAALVGNLWAKNSEQSQTICRAVGNAEGIFADAAKARNGCNKDAASVIAGASDDGPAKDLKPRNYTWAALQTGNNRPDKEFAELLMTMVGTVIYIPEEGSNPARYEFKPGSLDLLTPMLDGQAAAQAQVMRCSDSADCLNVSYSPFTVSDAAALKPRTKLLIQSMVGKVRSNEKLTTNEIALLGMTSVPLYKIIVVQTTSMVGLGDAEVDNLAEIVSIEILLAMANKFMGVAEQRMTSADGVDTSALTSWRQGLSNAKAELAVKRQGAYEKVQSTYKLIENTQRLEQQLRGDLAPQLSGALEFSRSISRSGV